MSMVLIFFERHYTKNKHLVDVDVLVDDSPEKLEKFNNESINGGKAICMKQTWNQECHNMYMGIDRLSDLMALL
jgi:5'(3')-deoxyribonucleotidase